MPEGAVVLNRAVRFTRKNLSKMSLGMLSLVQLFATVWTVGHLAPLSMGFPRQEY